MIKINNLGECDIFDEWAYLGPKRKKALKKSWAEVFRQAQTTKSAVEEYYCQKQDQIQIADIGTVLFDLDQYQEFLSGEEKIDVLAMVFDKHDAEYGVSWKTLRWATEDAINN